MQCVSPNSLCIRVDMPNMCLLLLLNHLCRCGLRYARTKQKEEGHVPSRRRMLTAADIQASPSSVVPGNQPDSTFNANKKRPLLDDDIEYRRQQRSGSPPYSTSSPSTSPSGSRDEATTAFGYQQNGYPHSNNAHHHLSDPRDMAVMSD